MPETTNAVQNDAETSHPNELRDALTDEGMNAEAFHPDDSDLPGGNRTVVLYRDENEQPATVERLAEEHGYFVFASDADEVTIAASADCEWRSA